MCSLHQYSATPSHMFYTHTFVTLQTKFFGLQGALVMINFVPDFVSWTAGNNKNGVLDPVPKGAPMEKVVEHIRHVGQLISYGYVGISLYSLKSARCWSEEARPAHHHKLPKFSAL